MRQYIYKKWDDLFQRYKTIYSHKIRRYTPKNGRYTPINLDDILPKIKLSTPKSKAIGSQKLTRYFTKKWDDIHVLSENKTVIRTTKRLGLQPHLLFKSSVNKMKYVENSNRLIVNQFSWSYYNNEKWKYNCIF